ncbi:GGDEF domain-containing protein, partial [Salmonella enterica subsp. enterica]
LLLGGYRVAFAVQMYRTRLRLREQAVTDALTGLLNRAGWNREAPACHARAAREGRAISVAFLDIDHFKSINDRHGHEAGDRVLQTLGALL